MGAISKFEVARTVSLLDVPWRLLMTMFMLHNLLNDCIIKMYPLCYIARMDLQLIFQYHYSMLLCLLFALSSLSIYHYSCLPVPYYRANVRKFSGTEITYLITHLLADSGNRFK